MSAEEYKDSLTEQFEELEQKEWCEATFMLFSQQSETPFFEWKREPPEYVSYLEHKLTLQWPLMDMISGAGAGYLDCGREMFILLSTLPKVANIGSRRLLFKGNTDICLNEDILARDGYWVKY